MIAMPCNCFVHSLLALTRQLPKLFTTDWVTFKHGMATTCFLLLLTLTFHPVEVMMSVWKSTLIPQETNFDVIQERVNSFTSPNDMGRMPMKIASGFAGFTAEQWKNWTIFLTVCFAWDSTTAALPVCATVC